MDRHEYGDNHIDHIKIHSDLIKLIRVLDDCIEHIDSFYCYTMKKQMLAGSTEN